MYPKVTTSPNHPKIGDKVLYKGSRPGENVSKDLTVGKFYTIKSIDVDWVNITNDRGQSHSTWLFYFMTTEDYREEQLNKII